MLMTLWGCVAADLDTEILFTESELYMTRGYACTCGLPEHTNLACTLVHKACLEDFSTRCHRPEFNQYRCLIESSAGDTKF